MISSHITLNSFGIGTVSFERGTFFVLRFVILSPCGREALLNISKIEFICQSVIFFNNYYHN